MAEKKTIVAVDDSIIILKMLKMFLENEYELYAFAKGSQALKFLKMRQPDLIILDIAMPEMDGFELLQEIKDLYSVKVPVMYLTSSNDKENIARAMSCGADDYVLKPVVRDTLLKKINNLI